MKVCVLGADGRTGIEVVNYAVKQGFDVISMLGHIKGSDPLMQTKGDIPSVINSFLNYIVEICFLVLLFFNK